MGTTGIRGTQIKDETVESVDIASGSIKMGELSTDIITSQTAETSVADGDLVLIYDTSASAFRKMTKSNFTSGVTADPAGSDGQIQYNNGGSAGGASGLYYDDVNNRLGVGTSSPAALLHITSSADGDVLFRATPYNQSNDGLVVTDRDGATYVTLNKAGQSTYPLDVNGNIRGIAFISTVDSTSYGFRVGQSQHTLYGVAEGNTDQGAVFLMKNNGGLVISGSDTSSPLRVQSPSSSNILVASGSGKVGIGTDSPDRALDILDASNPQLRLTHTDNTEYTDFQTDSSGNLAIGSSGDTVEIQYGGSTAALDIFSKSTDVYIRGKQQDIDVNFQVNDGGSTTTVLNLDAANSMANIAKFLSYQSVTYDLGSGTTSTITPTASCHLLTATTITGDMGVHTITLANGTVSGQVLQLIMNSTTNSINIQFDATTNIQGTWSGGIGIPANAIGAALTFIWNGSSWTLMNSNGLTMAS